VSLDQEIRGVQEIADRKSKKKVAVCIMLGRDEPRLDPGFVSNALP